MNSAAEQAMKMYMQSGGSGSQGTGGPGAGDLLKLAGKFLN